MTDSTNKRAIGSIVWTDLTVESASAVKDFYREVVGWEASPVDMGGYEDYMLGSPGGGPGVAGLCHARGLNAGLPPQWLVYVLVEDLDESLEAVRELGGEVIAEPRSYGSLGRYAVIRDPAGASLALFEDAS